MDNELLAAEILSAPAGARELLLECQQMLAGRRLSFTPLEQYVSQRRRYWLRQAQRNLRPRRWRAAIRAA